MPIAIRPVSFDRVADFLVPISTVFGMPISPDRVERVRAVPELDVLLGAFDEDAMVGSAGSFTFDLTVPGGVAVETAGLTLVAVLPTHRRRGILRQMMRRHLDDAHRRGQPVAALWASEGTIYGRYGYGVATLRGEIDLSRHRTAFVRAFNDGGCALKPPLGAVHDGGCAPKPPLRAVEPLGRMRLVSEAEAAATYPLIWEQVRLSRPGMLSRSNAWWYARRIADLDWLRAGRPPLQRALLEIDGRPAAYAIYRFSATFGHREHDISIDVTEALGDSPAATRALWRYLFDLDLVIGFQATLLPVDHPLLFLVAEPRKLQMRLEDGLWVRLVDVGVALSGRGYGEGAPLVIAVEDTFCPWNTGRYRLAGGAVERTDAAPDLALDVQALGALYLGGFSLTQLAQAGRVEEHTPGALRRGDALFRGEHAPWCPEIF